MKDLGILLIIIIVKKSVFFSLAAGTHAGLHIILKGCGSLFKRCSIRLEENEEEEEVVSWFLCLRDKRQESGVFLHSKCSAWDVVSLPVCAARGRCWRSWSTQSGALWLHCTALPFRKTRHKPGFLFLTCFFFMCDIGQIFIVECRFLTQAVFVCVCGHFPLITCWLTICWTCKLCTDSERMGEVDEPVNFQLGGLEGKDPAASFKLTRGINNVSAGSW